MRSYPALAEVSHAVIKILKREAYVLLVILPIRQVRTLEIIQRLLSHVALSFHHINLAIERILVGALGIRGALLQTINLAVRICQLLLNILHVGVASLRILERLLRVG